MIERSARELPELADLLNSRPAGPGPGRAHRLPRQPGQVRAAPRHPERGRDRAPGPGDAHLVRPAPAVRPARRRDPLRTGAGNRRRRPAARPRPPAVPPSENPGAPVNAIEVSALTMSYGDREVLRGVDFEVASGEVFCLLGPNGAGKTTTVEILEGFRQRTSGNVTVLGMDPQAPADQAPRADRHRPAGVRLPPAGPGQGADRLLALLLPQPARDQRPAQRRRAQRGQEHPGPQALRRSAPPPRPRPRAGRRPRPDLPRRAHDRLRPGVAPALLGGDREPAHARQDGPAHHPLPGRGGAAGRPGGDPARRPDPGGGHRAARRPAGGRADQDLVHRPAAAARRRPRRSRRALTSRVTGEQAVCLSACTRPPASPCASCWPGCAENDLGDLDDLSVVTPTLEDAYLQLVAGGAR